MLYVLCKYMCIFFLIFIGILLVCRTPEMKHCLLRLFKICCPSWKPLIFQNIPSDVMQENPMLSLYDIIWIKVPFKNAPANNKSSCFFKLMHYAFLLNAVLCINLLHLMAVNSSGQGSRRVKTHSGTFHISPQPWSEILPIMQMDGAPFWCCQGALSGEKTVKTQAAKLAFWSVPEMKRAAWI